MDKIEVTNGAVDPDHYGPIGDAARGIASYCDNPQRVHVYTAAFDAIKDILATRTDATPVAWMPIESAPKGVPTEDVGCRGETSHPPATDVAALVEALQEVISATGDYLPPDGISEQECIGRVIDATDNPKIIAALAPFTKGQP